MTELEPVALHRARDAFNRKWADMSSPFPTEEPEAGDGPIGYAIRAYLEASSAQSAIAERDARIAELEEAVRIQSRQIANHVLEWAQTLEQHETTEALLKEAGEVLVHLSRETTTDHIGDEWLTPTARAARSLMSKIGERNGE